jgi:hypothetical protein
MVISADEAQSLPLTSESGTYVESSSDDSSAETTQVDSASLRRYVTQPSTQLAAVYQAIGQD